MASDPRLNQRYGAFVIRRRLGGGAMGEVYLGWDARMERHVAVKILSRERARDRDFVTRFRREARALGSLEHQNVVGVYDFGEARGEFYIAMQFVDGLDLDAALYRREEDGSRLPLFRPLPIHVALAMARDICLGLEHLHEHGVIHRDLKPANVMLSRSGVLKITDFGLARRVEESILVTQSLQAVGTPAYMSPEQAAGQADLDARSDVFSMGILTYDLLAGRRPFGGTNQAAVLYGIQSLEPRPLADDNPLVPPPVIEVVGRMLVKDRERRCSSIREARAVFERGLADLGVFNGPDLLREFVARPRDTVERLNRVIVEQDLQRGVHFERQGTDRIQDAVDAYSRVLFLDPRHDEARDRFDRLVHESSGGTRPIPLRVPAVPSRPKPDDAPTAAMPASSREPGAPGAFASQPPRIDGSVGSGSLIGPGIELPPPSPRVLRASIVAATTALVFVLAAIIAMWRPWQDDSKSALPLANPDPTTSPMDISPAGDASRTGTVVPAGDVPSTPAAHATLRVVSAPPGALVALNDTARSQQPTPQFMGLSPGTHRVRVVRSGYVTRETTIVLASGEARVLPMPLARVPMATLTVTSPVPGARVAVDGRAMGATGTTLQVAAGRRRVAVSASGYVPVTIDLDAAAGQAYQREVELMPLPSAAPTPPPASSPVEVPAAAQTSTGGIRVRKGGGAFGRVWIDNVQTSHDTPHVFGGLTPRDYLVSVRRPGYVSIEGDQWVKVRAGETTTVTITLKPQ